MTYQITRLYDDSEVVVAVGIEDLHEAELLARKYTMEAATDSRFSSMPDFYIDGEL